MNNRNVCLGVLFVGLQFSLPVAAEQVTRVGNETFHCNGTLSIQARTCNGVPILSDEEARSTEQPRSNDQAPALITPFANRKSAGGGSSAVFNGRDYDQALKQICSLSDVDCSQVQATTGKDGGTVILLGATRAQPDVCKHPCGDGNWPGAAERRLQVLRNAQNYCAKTCGNDLSGTRCHPNGVGGNVVPPATASGQAVVEVGACVIGNVMLGEKAYVPSGAVVLGGEGGNPLIIGGSDSNERTAVPRHSFVFGGGRFVPGLLEPNQTLKISEQLPLSRTMPAGFSTTGGAGGGSIDLRTLGTGAH